MSKVVKKYWKKTLTFALALWPAFRLFIRWPMAAVSIATIPIQSFIQRHVNLGPVTSKVVGFAIFGILMVLSWYVAELIVLLAAAALVMEVFLFVRCIYNRFEEQSIERNYEVA